MSNGSYGNNKRSGGTRRKSCRFCAEPKMLIDYKEPRLLTSFTTERGKIIPRRITGNCAFHQRRLGDAIKRARLLAFIPFTSTH